MNSASLLTEFKNPSNDYRMIPLFRINDEVDRNEVRWQIKSLKQQGYGGVFSICECFRDGAPEKFMSEWWMQVVDWISEACTENGLQFWAYDDEDWPSGSVGGQLIEQHAETSWKYLKPTEHKVSGSKAVEVPVGDGIFVAATAHQTGKGGRIVADSVRDITAEASGETLKWKAPAGKWVVTVYTAHPGLGIFIDGYGDLMDAHSMKLFVDWVYGGHYDRVTAKGNRIVGFFTDEPALSYSMIKWADRFHWFPSMPWSPELAEWFEKRHGYSWRSRLPLLYHDDGREAFRFRCHHWDTCAHMYFENYFGRIYRFCEERGVLSSGHLVVEEDFPNHLAQQGGNMLKQYRNMHIPGMDWIHPFEEKFHDLPATTPKYPTSAAHLMGRPRAWAESFAASGWGLSFQEMRRIVNWEHINGINMQIPITYKYSFRGASRSAFYAPGISYQQPWWTHSRGFSDYEARMCALVSGGGHVAQVALVYPSAEIMGNCWNLELLESRGKDFNALGDAIRSSGYDFDLLDDEAIEGMTQVKDGMLRTPTEGFEVLVMPKAGAASRKTVARCGELAKSGGAALFVGELPANSAEGGSADPDFAAQLKELFGDSYAIAKSGKAAWHRVGAGWVGFAPTDEDAVTMLRDVAPPELTTEEGEPGYFAYRRRLEDGDLYLVYNHCDKKRRATVTVRAAGHPEVWDPVTGVREALAEYRTTPRGTVMPLAFEPHETRVLFIIAGKSALPVAGARQKVAEVKVSGPFKFRAEETMTKPHIAWNFEHAQTTWTSKQKETGKVPARMPAGDWCKHGLKYFSGIGHYETRVNLPAVPKGGRVILSLGRVGVSAEVAINGKRAGIVFFSPYELDVTKLVKKGSNEVRISVANTLSNYFSQFKELAGKTLSEGGDFPSRRVSGLLGPVRFRIEK